MGDSQLATSYEVIGKLADGDIAELFLAKASTHDGGSDGATAERLVAVKRIPRKAAQNVELVKSFLEEAQQVARLTHPNIARVTDVGTLGGSYFFAMEYVNGETLRALIEHAHSKKLQVPIRSIVTIAAGIAAGLHHAHEHTLVHGAVMPSNVLVSRDGIVKLVDFGTAKTRARASSQTPADKSAYWSPEQCRGEAVDRRSDLFSLGVVLWELTTLEELFHRGGDAKTRAAIENEQAAVPSSRRYDVPPELDAVIARLLAKSQADRYQTAEELIAALESVAVKLTLQLSTSDLARTMRQWFGNVPEPVVASSDKPLVVKSEPVPANLTVAPAANPAIDDLLDHVRNAGEILRAAAVAAASAVRSERTTSVPGIGDTVEETRENFEQIRDRILAQARTKKATRPPAAGDAVPAVAADSPSAAIAALGPDGRPKRETLNPTYNAYSFITDVAGKASEPIRRITTTPPLGSDTPASHQVGPRTASFQAVSDQIVADAIAAHAVAMTGDLASSNGHTSGKNQESMAKSEDVKSENETATRPATESHDLHRATTDSNNGIALPRTESIDLEAKAESSSPDIAVPRTSSKDLAASSKNDIAVARTSSKDDVAVARTSSKDDVAVSRTSSKDKVAVSRTKSKDKVAASRTKSKDMKRAKSASKGAMSKAAITIGLTPVDELDENTWPPLPEEGGGGHDFRDLDDGQPLVDEPHNKRPAWALPVALAAGAVLVLAVLFAMKAGNKPSRRRAAVAAVGSADLNGGIATPGSDLAVNPGSAGSAGSDIAIGSAGSDMATGSNVAAGSDLAFGSAGSDMGSAAAAGSNVGSAVATAAVDPAAEKAKAEADKLAAEQQAKADADKAKADKLAAEQQAKADKLAAEQQAKADKAAAAAQAKADKAAAAEAAAEKAKALAAEKAAAKAATAAKAKADRIAAADKAKTEPKTDTTKSDKTDTTKASKEPEKSIEDLVAGGEFAKANTACKTNTIFNSMRLSACTIAACNVKDQGLAQRWIRAISKSARADLIKSCATMGVTVEDPSAPAPAAPAPAASASAPAP